MATLTPVDATTLLHAGGVVAYPTESCYGLGCNAADNSAIVRILKLKQRHWSQGLIVVVADIRQLNDWLQPLDEASMANILASWPGPNTWLLPCYDNVSIWLRGKHNSLAVRISAHPVVAQLTSHFAGPLVSTSANITGQPACTSVQQVNDAFANSIDAIVTGDIGADSKPSVIRDGITGKQLR